MVLKFRNLTIWVRSLQDGVLTVTVQDNQGDLPQTFQFSGAHDADLGPFGIVGTGGETIKTVTLSFTGTSSNDSFKEVKQIDFSYDPRAVPLPASAFLLASGLIGLIGIRRRFKR